MRASVLGFTSLLVLLGMGGCSSGSHHSQAPARISGRTLALGTGAARTGHAAALLGDGTVLLAGGMVGGSATRTAEVFDPATGAVTPVAAQMQDARVNATATVLTDGRVLLAGGDNGSGTPLATAEVYDPATGAFSTAGAMTSARTLHTATRLPGGHVLIVGGRADASTVLASVEEFDPAASPASAWTFEPSGLALLRARARHTATLLGDGTILVAGGEDGGGTPLAQAYAAERVDPQSGSAYTTGLMTARARHTATLLRSGDVLVAGGFDGASDLSSVELYRPGTDDFAAAPGLSYARHDHTATLTPEGRVVLTGGTSGAATTAHVEIYDPVAGTTGAAGVISPPRSGHVATLLPSGRVLLSGGGSGQAEVLDRLNDLWTSPSVANYVPRYGHTATVLPKGPDAGKVLIVGGIDPYIGYLDSAQIYDPVHNTLTPTSGAQALPSMGGARAFHTATVLPNGDVLVAGGKSGGTNSLATAKLYRAATRSWAAAAGTMSAPRANHTATLLSTGKVLLAGGDDGTAPLASADLYDYAADAFTGAGSMSASRTEHAAASLPDGRVLLLGGAGTPSLASADLYDPSTGLFGAAGVLNTGRARMSATPLADGRVLVVGGTDGSAELGTAELFDPGTASFPPADVIPLVNARFGHAAVPLPSGEVVVAGGQDASGYLSYVERYDPAGQDFTPVNSLTTERDTFTFTLLPSGRLLAWGGDNSGQQAPAERYDFFSPAAPATPDLPISASPPSWVPGASLTLSPAAGSFTGSTEAASGDTRSSAVNEPIFVLERQDADGLTYAETTGFPAAGAPATSAQVKLPGALSGGWWWIRALVAGVPGQAEPFFVLAPFYITPTDPTVPPRGSQGFTARGGAGPPYTWSLTTNASGGHIDTDPNTFAGSYLAGATPDVVDVVSVTDAVGNTATTTVHVGDGVTIHGSGPVPPLGAVTFTASGGSGTGYQWTLTTNASGGHVDTDPNTFAGAYVAGNAAGTDRVTVTDSLGNTAYVDVVVTTPVAIAPLTASTTPLGTVDFTASGGAGGYTWTVSHNLSGAGFSSGNPGPNATYQAGRTGSVTDTVRVTDSLGSYAEATVEVSAAISIVPSSATTPPRGSLSFTASGGTDTGFAWSLSTNASGGTIDPSSGAYTAGATPDVTDVVRVEDSLGNLATVEVTVGPGISITPLEPGAYPGQTVTLVAQGGSGTGYTWSMVSVTSNGGTIDPTTGVYTAGTARGATDIVEVTDSLQNVATVDVAVWPDWKPAGSGCGTLGGGTGPLGLLLVFWLGWRGRARRLFGRGARWLGFAALFLVPGVTRAQTPPVSTSFVVQRFQPAGGAYDLLGVESAQVPGHEKLTLRLYGNYASRPLVLSAPGMDKVALLRSQSGVDLTVAVGLMDWAEVSAVVPGVVSQSREQDRFLPPELRQRVASSGLSDLRIVPKARLLELGRFRLGVSAPVSLPTGDRKAFLGQGGFTFGPTALIELDALGPARVLLNGGAIFREERHLIDLTVGNAYTYGAGLEWPFQAGAERFSALGTLQGEAGMKDRSATARPMEALAGLRWMAPSGLLVTLGGGPGIGKGYGTPQYRVFAEIGFTTSTRDRLDRREPEPVKKAEEPKPPEPEVARPEPPAEPPKAEEPKAAEAQPATEPEPQVEPKTLPPPAPTEQVEALRIDARIYFDFNKKEIRDEFRPVLKHLAKRIASEPRMRVVRIEGHADDLGPPDYNLWLSEERARAVKAFLEKNGVPPARIAVIGFGKSKPARPGRSTEDRAKNRRVEFSVEEQ